MKNKIYLIGGLLAAAAFLAYLFSQNNNPVNQQPPVISNNGTNSLQPLITQNQDLKEFVLIATDFKFDQTEIRVKNGDRVRIILQNQDGFHDWKVDEFNAATNKINAGQTDTIEFTADKTGNFEYYCSVSTHRQMGMKGTLIVE